MFSQCNIWFMYSLQCIAGTLRFLSSVSGIKSEYIGLFLILLIGLPLFFGYLKLRVLTSRFLWFGPAELEPPVVNVSELQLRTCVAWHVIKHTARQQRIFTDNELHLLGSFHGVSSPANNCRSYLYERARFEANLVFLRRSCRELYVMNGRRRTKIKWRNFGTDLSLHVNGTV